MERLQVLPDFHSGVGKDYPHGINYIGIIGDENKVDFDDILPAVFTRCPSYGKEKPAPCSAML